MKILDILNFSLKNLSRRKTRSLLTILGFVIGISLYIAFINVSYGVKSKIFMYLERLGSNKIIIEPYSGFMIEKEDIDKIKRVKYVDVIFPLGFTTTTIKYKGKFYNVFVTAVDAPYDMFEEFGIGLEEGNYIKKKYQALIGYTLAKKDLESIRIGEKIEAGKCKFRIVEITSPTNLPIYDKRILVSFEDGKSCFNISNYAAVIIAVDRPENIDYVIDTLERLLNKDSKRFIIISLKETIKNAMKIVNIVNYFILAISTLAMLIAIVQIINVMYTAVLERRKEIGILKAIGASDFDIFLLFVVESGLMSLIGGIIGCIVGNFFGIYITHIISHKIGILIPFKIDLFMNLLMAIISFFIGVLAGILPARKAAKLNVIDVIRYG